LARHPRPIITGRTVNNDSGHFEKTMRKFKKKVANSGVVQEVRDRQYFVKPTMKRKLARAAAKSRWAQKLRSEKLPKKNY